MKQLKNIHNSNIIDNTTTNNYKLPNLKSRQMTPTSLQKPLNIKPMTSNSPSYYQKILTNSKSKSLHYNQQHYTQHIQQQQQGGNNNHKEYEKENKFMMMKIPNLFEKSKLGMNMVISTANSGSVGAGVCSSNSGSGNGSSNGSGGGNGGGGCITTASSSAINHANVSPLIHKANSISNNSQNIDANTIANIINTNLPIPSSSSLNTNSTITTITTIPNTTMTTQTIPTLETEPNLTYSTHSTNPTNPIHPTHPTHLTYPTHLTHPANPSTTNSKKRLATTNTTTTSTIPKHSRTAYDKSSPSRCNQYEIIPRNLLKTYEDLGMDELSTEMSQINLSNMMNYMATSMSNPFDYDNSTYRKRNNVNNGNNNTNKLMPDISFCPSLMSNVYTNKSISELQEFRSNTPFYDMTNLSIEDFENKNSIASSVFNTSKAKNNSICDEYMIYDDLTNMNHENIERIGDEEDHENYDNVGGSLSIKPTKATNKTDNEHNQQLQKRIMPYFHLNIDSITTPIATTTTIVNTATTGDGGGATSTSITPNANDSLSLQGNPKDLTNPNQKGYGLQANPKPHQPQQSQQALQQPQHQQKQLAHSNLIIQTQYSQYEEPHIPNRLSSASSTSSSKAKSISLNLTDILKGHQQQQQQQQHCQYYHQQCHHYSKSTEDHTNDKPKPITLESKTDEGLAPQGMNLVSIAEFLQDCKDGYQHQHHHDDDDDDGRDIPNKDGDGMANKVDNDVVAKAATANDDDDDNNEDKYEYDRIDNNPHNISVNKEPSNRSSFNSAKCYSKFTFNCKASTDQDDLESDFTIPARDDQEQKPLHETQDKPAKITTSTTEVNLKQVEFYMEEQRDREVLHEEVSKHFNERQEHEELDLKNNEIIDMNKSEIIQFDLGNLSITPLEFTQGNENTIFQYQYAEQYYNHQQQRQQEQQEQDQERRQEQQEQPFQHLPKLLLRLNHHSHHQGEYYTQSKLMKMEGLLSNDNNNDEEETADSVATMQSHIESVREDMKEKEFEEMILKLKYKIHKYLTTTELNQKEIMQLQEIEQKENFKLEDLQKKMNNIIAEYVDDDLGKINMDWGYLTQSTIDPILQSTHQSDIGDFNQEDFIDDRLNDIVIKIKDLEDTVRLEQEKKKHYELMLNLIQSTNYPSELTTGGAGLGTLASTATGGIGLGTLTTGREDIDKFIKDTNEVATQTSVIVYDSINTSNGSLNGVSNSSNNSSSSGGSGGGSSNGGNGSSNGSNGGNASNNSSSGNSSNTSGSNTIPKTLFPKIRGLKSISNSLDDGSSGKT